MQYWPKRYWLVTKTEQTNASTADLIRSMRQVSETLRSSSTSLLSAAVRLASAGEDREARHLIDLAKGIQEAEDEMRKHVNDARTGRIIKLSPH
jgi:hypothetical protein